MQKNNPTQKLIDEARLGKRQAFNVILEKNWDYVFNFLKSRNISDEDAEDLTIETFAKAFDKIDKFDENLNFRTWICTIAKNTHIDLLRKENKLFIEFNSPFLDNIEFTEDESRDLYLGEQSEEKIWIKFQKLRPVYKKCLEMKIIEEKSIEEISQIMGIKPGNVKVIILRAKNMLKKLIKT